MQESEEDRLRRMRYGAAQDQAQAGAADMGKLGGVLYQSLIDHNVPKALAATLVRDWFFLQLSRALWGDAMPPQTPFWRTGEWGDEDEAGQ